MSKKLNPAGQYIPFRGWTVVSPVRRPENPQPGNALDASQLLWTNLFAQALELLKASECAANFAPLPLDSMHMTLTGLTEEKSGTKPVDMPLASWEEVEAALIQRVFPLFSAENLGALVRLELRFKQVRFGQGATIDLEAITKHMNDEVQAWKTKVVAAAGLPKKPAQKFHISLAYRTRPAGDLAIQEEALKAKITRLFDSGAPANWKVPPLICLPPYFSCYNDMTEFPSVPCYPMNQPLRLLLNSIHGAELTFTPPRQTPLWSNAILPPHPSALSAFNIAYPSSSNALPSTLSLPAPKPSCMIVVLGRALKDGSVTKSAESHMCRGHQSYIEAKESSRYSNVFLVLCGGYTTPGLEVSEAFAMKDWMQAHFADIDPNDLILEDCSSSIVETALYIRRLLLTRPELASLESLQVVSTASVLARATFTFTSILSRLPRELEGMALCFTSCKDADAAEEAFEMNLAENLASLLRRSLANTTSFNISSPLDMVKRNRLSALIQTLDTLGSQVATVKDPRTGDGLLHFAVAKQRVRIVDELLRRGFDVTAENQAKKTPLDLAVETANLDLISMMLTHTARLPNGAAVLDKLSAEPLTKKNLDPQLTSAIYLLLDLYRSDQKPACFVFGTTAQHMQSLKELNAYVRNYSLSLRPNNLLVIRVASQQSTAVFETLTQTSGLCHPAVASVEVASVPDLMVAAQVHFNSNPSAVVALILPTNNAKQTAQKIAVSATYHCPL